MSEVEKPYLAYILNNSLATKCYKYGKKLKHLDSCGMRQAREPIAISVLLVCIMNATKAYFEFYIIV